MSIYNKYMDLLTVWCDAMLGLQLTETASADFDGGLLCPACKMIHGRCHDAIYPYVFLYHKTGDGRYLNAARALFEWSDCLLTDAGSYYNDAQNDWEAITVFSVSAMARTLLYHEPALPDDFREGLRIRLHLTGEWVYQNITVSMASPVNYQAAAAEALALCGTYLKDEDYLRAAGERARYCLAYFTDEGLFYGECSPRDYRSEKGCVGVDIGYNLEESLPALMEYAELCDDKEVLRAVKMSLYTHMQFILPDGGIDNSFGTRNYKWTYWGSRTSDSFLHAFERMAKSEQEPAFAEVKYHYYRLLLACTGNGLLYGGPDYETQGEPPCVHHTMCKAKGLAQLLEEELTEVKERQVADFYYDKPCRITFPSIATEKYCYGGFIADVTAYDVPYCPHGHVSGSTVSLLWNSSTGPLLAASTMKHILYEVTNTQLTLRKEHHRSLALRFDKWSVNEWYSTAYDFTSEFSSRLLADEIIISGRARLADASHRTAGEPVEIEYRLKEQELACRYRTKSDGILVVPLIADTGKEYVKEGGRITMTSKRQSRFRFETDNEIAGITPVFYLDGGFRAWEIVILQDGTGKSGFRIICEA